MAKKTTETVVLLRGINPAVQSIFETKEANIDKAYLTTGTGPGGRYCHRDFRRAIGLFVLDHVDAPVLKGTPRATLIEWTKRSLESYPDSRMVAWLAENSGNSTQMSRFEAELVSYINKEGMVPVFSAGASADFWLTK